VPPRTGHCSCSEMPNRKPSSAQARGLLLLLFELDSSDCMRAPWPQAFSSSPSSRRRRRWTSSAASSILDFDSAAWTRKTWTQRAWTRRLGLGRLGLGRLGLGGLQFAPRLRVAFVTGSTAYCSRLSISEANSSVDVGRLPRWKAYGAVLSIGARRLAIQDAWQSKGMSNIPQNPVADRHEVKLP